MPDVQRRMADSAEVLNSMTRDPVLAATIEAVTNACVEERMFPRKL